MKKSLLLMLLLMYNASIILIAQTKTISGNITGQNNGEPLAGVNIVIKGTNNGTVSDAYGKFSLSVSEKAILKISLIGYVPQEISVGNQQVIKITLLADNKELDEIVVVGYGTQKKRDLTGSTTTIKGEGLEKIPVPSFDAALQGRAAGLQVSQQGGAPGGAVRIQIRGTSSVSSGTEPLYVIDGVIIFQDISGIAIGRTSNVLNPLTSINPADIESIDVLKDAAATAIYGSRGANGVVIVTTKTGKKGQAKTTVDFNTGVSNAINLIDFASGSQWLSMVDKARQNSVGYGISAGQEQFNPATLSSNNLPTPAGISGNQFGPLTTWTRSLAEQTNTNWRDEMLRQGSVKELNLSSTGGFDKGSFFLSGQYRNEEGIIKTHELSRYAFRSNLEFTPTQKLRAGAKLSFSYMEFNQPQIGIGNNGGGVGRQNFGATGGWGQVNTGALPIMPIYNSDGTYFDPLRGRNTVAGNDPNNFNSRSNQNRLIANVFLDYTILPGWNLRTEGSIDFLNSNSIYWANDVIRYNRVGQEEGRYVKNRSANVYSSYNKDFVGEHSISFTVGTEVQKTEQRRQDYAFEGLVGSQQEIGEIGNSTQFITAVSGIFGDNFFLSYFGRANYKLKDRYMLGLSFRRDGSTAFGTNNRFGNFPAVSAGWIISSEDFFKTSTFFQPFSLLKLRGSYGQTGNANIPSFAYLNNYVNWPVYGQSSSLGFSVLSNPNIGWEKNNQFDASIEFGLLGNRINGSIGGFVRTSKDMLLNVPVAPNVGIGPGSQSIITNIGDLRNQGFEFELSTVNINKNNFKWKTDFNFSTTKNEVLRLTPQFEVLPSGSLPVAIGILQGTGITQIGGRLGTFYLAEYAGLDAQGFESIYEIDQTILRQTGKTVKTGNIIRATQANINANRIVQEGKTGLPTFYGGLTNTFSFKGFEVSTLFTFQGGNYIYDALEESTSYVRTGSNIIRADVVNNTWSESNTNAKYPKLTWNMRDNFNNQQGNPAAQTLGTRTTRYLYEGDFIRFKSLQIAYNLPSSLVKILKLQNVRIYANAQNLFTSTKYKGYDPELVVLGNNQDRNLNQGFLSNAPIPQVKTYNAGVSISF